ncbi:MULTISPECIES: aldehyde dehydrogenase family protein [unclassified Pseudomonas]|jgi:aldehyde dehydrogenase (NAD+)|uniref:aldehyde dehydrogenase family protein n=1 Tax=unclassified Pseudomonas TaxID=196821 RepID=UPI000C1587FF|nr:MULTISPECIES: aldehyde dehydrogenase family protein [unclassified Pseudomonas]MCF5233327.1 aldehyde dehydrogenase family protein [Pseudomonas sp. PA-5-4H]MCF5238733.1 aldehyde dehydrogenase family protein [Pseudomonas sp. PA-5-4G]MCF5250299.1 aldehyde dehydrogenase family protein [Pseudomonas sp. PA-5-4B]MCF5256977.1 aldehyde dehydrogenase family protein [Pseudomonas sp. PA-5-4B]MCF5262530.1 aldehyde dehydrogenase family protein [Pseudomonas sp. PA-5-4A]
MNHRDFYIDGQWVKPLGAETLAVLNPATECVITRISLGTVADLDLAVAAARRAFDCYSQWSREQRLELLAAIIDGYRQHSEALAQCVHQEMGAPLSLARSAHVPAGLGHLQRAYELLKDYAFERLHGSTLISREPIGVCGLITPWNWPLNQLTCKLAPALAAGCTLVLKPSEKAPLSALLLADILHRAGVPKGVFNLVNGDGPTLGEGIARHADIDMVSFTGSTGAGVAVAKAAAQTVKRVCQELGGKSANLILADADFDAAVRHGVSSCFRNSGQSCNAPTRLLVPRAMQARAVQIAREVAAQVCFDDSNPATAIGPLANQAQFERVQRVLGAVAQAPVCGGVGRPEALTTGFYTRPTVFADVDPQSPIAREEVFGPVLVIIPYDSEAQAIAIANDSPYGLSGYVSAGTLERARFVARQLRTGMVHLNGSKADNGAPFGGYKQSGNGREWGVFGLEDYLEVKSMFGYAPNPD